MLEKFVPDIYTKSIYTIKYELLKKSGIKCILFDLDNTLVASNVKRVSKKLKNLIDDLKDEGFRVIIFSNSPKYRVEPFKNALNVDSAHFCRKPSKDKYEKIMTTFNYKPGQIAAVGDQLLTDVYGANNVEFTSILVNPLSRHDFFTVWINRALERILYRRLRKKDLLVRGRYYD